ncbi:MAG: SH3 domain-containing protein [Oscillospiraceae bacterium]|jgi:uncharacterized protein YgiM (DUF1202 family)|nr:SH3 domain-containing protein [Oscillospiraceae bacterium]
MAKRFFALLAAAVLLVATLPAAFAAESFHTGARVNLRAAGSLEAAVLRTIEPGVAVEVLEHDPDGWSKVTMDGADGYIKSEFLVPSSQITEETVPTVYVTTDKVNFRKAPSTDAAVLQQVERGVQVFALAYDPEGWSEISINGVTGYIKSEYLGPEGEPEPVVRSSLESSETYVTTGKVNFRKGPSSDAGVIRQLGAGTKVAAVAYDPEGWSLVLFNNEQGYIKSEFLADGSGGGAVELLDWQTVRGFLPLHTAIPVLDIRTGITYTVKSFSNGLHADVETSTTEDTEILKRIYGGKWSWSPRPVWVTIAGRTIAASINGMPHGGGVIAGNGMDGQICLHFLGSKTHNGNVSFEKLHQDGVMEAWNAR